MSIVLDNLDKLGAAPFDGYLVRKDLVRKYARQYPVPTYVVEFLLGRYCASTNEEEINEGLKVVEKQIQNRTVRTGEEELVKAKAREDGSVKIIDVVHAKLDAKNDRFIAELPSLALKDIRIDDTLVKDNERMLTDGFYAEVTLSYDGSIAQEKAGLPFKIAALRPIQMSRSDVLEVFAKGRAQFTTTEWMCVCVIGNLDVDVEQAQRIGHLLSPLPPEMRDDTAFMDRIHGYAPGWNFPKLDPRVHFTDHFGLVSDFLSECWTRLRGTSRVSVMHDRVHLGGALSGRDIEAVNKTVSGLTKLLFPDPEMPVPDADLEWIVRLALETRRRVKEQQKRVFKSEFRNTHFSFTLGAEGTEQFVSTPELHSDEAIESDPLPPGQVWGVSLGASETGAGLYRIDVTCSRGGGVRILNQPPPPAFRESVKVREQNLYARSREMVGDRNPKEEEFSIQMRPMDNDKSGAGLGVPVIVAMCGAMLGKNTRGGTVVAGALNLGGSIEMVPNAVRIAELAVDKQAATLLMPVSARRQLNDLPDEMWTELNIEFYKDAADAVFKALVE